LEENRYVNESRDEQRLSALMDGERWGGDRECMSMGNMGFIAL